MSDAVCVSRTASDTGLTNDPAFDITSFRCVGGLVGTF
jgi:hypothetical protein